MSRSRVSCPYCSQEVFADYLSTHQTRSRLCQTRQLAHSLEARGMVRGHQLYWRLATRLVATARSVFEELLRPYGREYATGYWPAGWGNRASVWGEVWYPCRIAVVLARLVEEVCASLKVGWSELTLPGVEVAREAVRREVVERVARYIDGEKLTPEGEALYALCILEGGD